MNHVAISDGADRFEELVDLAEAGTQHAITENGRPIAVVMSFDEYSRLSTDNQNPRKNP